jgi:alpha-ketoglutarate-dependent taurine dioxygenase
LLLEIDHKYAKSIQQDDLLREKELKEHKERNEYKGEAAALRIAVEERKQLALRAQSKRQLEESDEKYARQTILDDVESTFKQEATCKADMEYALQVKLRSTKCSFANFYYSLSHHSLQITL